MAIQYINNINNGYNILIILIMAIQYISNSRVIIYINKYEIHFKY